MAFKKYISAKDALVKAASFCAYQERCHKEVKDKLYGMGLNTDDVNWVITELITENFLNERRFAEAFVRGKFNYKKWGRKKIEYALLQKAITSGNIRLAMKQIDENEYKTVLKELLLEKSETVNASNSFAKKDKLFKYAMGKGYETETIKEVLSEISL
ncbi:regulatory protein RecX [Flammeovirgaceae bacterium SG7u.111]|nr:regulatory protein RecX [Flammeovirgaceae bacterium SG7u.132]WPO35831.1 regulatory protein RecX [Flammeovirgaceae bacterium SG7u.111]